MRGLPSSGKSHLARRLVGECGVLLETDQFFYRENPDGTRRFHYREELLSAARQWIFESFQQAIAAGRSPIVLDRGNGLNEETRRFAQYAVDRNYRVELKEPDSPWWLEIKELMRHRPESKSALDRWAVRLSEMSRETHRVPLDVIQRWMSTWRVNLTVDDILRGRS
jgi:hypothetical protein